jgi:glutamate racemase
MQIGVFDSGVGGLAVLRHVHRIATKLPTTYVADRRHLPYGEKTEAFVADRAHTISKHLIDEGAAVVAMACNTASAAALEQLRIDFPDTRFVGMEPAIKPAASATATGVIGVLATKGTLAGRLMARVEAAYGSGVEILKLVGDGLASAVEFGTENGTSTADKLGRHVAALDAAGADTLVLGCTHYSFLADQIAQLSQGRLRIIDPSEAVARQVVRMALEVGIVEHEPARHRYITTGHPQRVGKRLSALTGVVETVERVDW